MQNVEPSANQIKELLQQSRTVLLATRAQASFDGLAATLALAEVIKAFGRQVILTSPEEITGPGADLPGAKDFVREVGPKSLLISLPYNPGSIAKVNYYTEGDRFNLLVTPRSGSSLSPDSVNFSKSGQDYDLAVVLDTPDLGLLGPLYEAEKETWQGLPLVNIDRHPANAQFGKVNVLDPEAQTTSEIVGRLIEAASLPFPKVSVELLLSGIRAGTADFRQAGPGSFEEASKLSGRLKAGRGESSEEKLINESLKKDTSFQLGSNL